MLYIEVKGNIEKALKTYKNKVFKTKIHDELRERKEFKKKCVERREKILKAKHKQHLQTKEEA
jgi:ribosomal protein S21